MNYYSLRKRITTIPAPIYLGLLVAAGALVRFLHISKASIWHDEGYTMMLAPMPIHEIIERTARDVHPPLYYILLHGWMNIFGSNEIAARGFSAVCMLAIIPIGYLLVKRLWSEKAARFAALFIALGPFLVRYSQEARMYALVALLLAAATYLLVRALDSKQWSWWVFYGIVMSAALYTHYYSIFMIAVHWLYVISRTSKTRKDGLWNIRWWIGNAIAAALFLPWLPSALDQVRRVQGSFWIPKATIQTLPTTLWQFLAYGRGKALGPHTKQAIAIVFVAILIGVFIKYRKRFQPLVLLTSYALLGPVLVWLVSYVGPRPIYVDRYFVFAAVGFCCLLGVLVSLLPRFWAGAAAVALVGLSIGGTMTVYKDATHQMKTIGMYVNDNFRPGDEILSGELYTYFDFSYYNHTGMPVHLWSKNGVNGYGESSLIYDRADELIIKNLADIHPASGRLWVVGKTGTKDYYTKIPATWMPVGPKVTARDSAVQQYIVAPRGSGAVALQ